MHTILRDLSFSITLLYKRRVFNAAMVITIAITIAAATCIFLPFYALVLRRIPFPSPERLVILWETNRDTGEQSIPVMEGAYAHYRKTLLSFTDIAAFVPTNPLLPPVRIAGTGRPVAEINATPELFKLLGVGPALGRVFVASEAEPGAPPAAILSYRMWTKYFGERPEVIGKPLVLDYFGDRVEYTIVGVMPQGFQFPYPIFPEKPDVWLSLSYEQRRFTPGNNFYVIGKLPPHVTLSLVQAELSAAASRLSLDQPRSYGSHTVRAVPLQSELLRTSKPIFLAFAVALALVMLIGCANIANLVIARGMSRRREAMIRIALGATRADIIRQTVAEITVLCALGSACGLTLGFWGASALPFILPPSIYIPRANSLVFDWAVLLFAFSIFTLVSLCVGWISALRMTADDAAQVLRSSHSLPTVRPTALVRRSGSIVVVAEVAMAVTLVSGACVTLKTLSQFLRDERGNDPDRLLVMSVLFSNDAPEDAKTIIAEYQEFTERALRIPGVNAVALADQFPRTHYRQFFTATSMSPRIGGLPQPAELHIVTPSYFSITSVHLLEGRYFDRSDVAGVSGVAVINDTMAQRYFAHIPAIGVHIHLESRPSKEWPTDFQVIGIVHEAPRAGGLAEPSVYVPFAQAPMRNLSVVTRTNIEPGAVARPLRDQLLQMAPGKLIINRTETGRDIVAEVTARTRLIAMELSSFGAVAVILAIAGVYGLISFYTSHRTHEMGVRMALGSTRVRLVISVVTQGLVLVALGVAIGFVFASILVRFLRHVEDGILPLDIGLFALVALLFGSIGIAAAYGPARRAASIDPAEVLRAE